MNFTSEHRKLLIGIALTVTVTVASTIIAGIALFHYKHLYIGSGPNQSSSNSLRFWKESCSVTVKPVSKWSKFVLFSRRRYYKAFEVKVTGGDIGFPPSTAINFSTTTGNIIRITCSDAIKPTFSNGASATNWSDSKCRYMTKTVFITGPNPGIRVGMGVTLMSKGKEVPDNGLRVLVSPPGNKPIDVDYDTDVNWQSDK